MILQSGQVSALQNLSRKKSGKEVDWINIGDARALTDLGLAERGPAGWNITDAGADFLRKRDQPAD